MEVDEIEIIAAIYDAVGDVERWRLLTERLAATPLTAEIEYHIGLARAAHEQSLHLAGEVAALSSVYAQLALGALIVDQGGQVLKVNDMADRVLAQRAGLLLEDNRLQVTDADVNAALYTALARETNDAGSGRTPFLVVPRLDKPPLAIFVLQLDDTIQQFFEHRRVAALLLIDPDQATAPSAHVLRALFGFTARESECASLLMQGHTLDEAARALGVTRNTARTFVAQMTAKTDSHGQAELMGRLLAIPQVTAAGCLDRVPG